MIMKSIIVIFFARSCTEFIEHSSFARNRDHQMCARSGTATKTKKIFTLRLYHNS
jgi:hypothetical protein